MGHNYTLEELFRRQEEMKETVNGIDTCVRGIELTLAERRGERRVAQYLAGAAGGLLVLVLGWIGSYLGLSK